MVLILLALIMQFFKFIYLKLVYYGVNIKYFIFLLIFLVFRIKRIIYFFF